MRKFSYSCLLLVLCMLAVPFQTAADDFIRGDVDLDGRVNIQDVTTLIDYLLNQVWPDDDQGQIETETFTVNGVSFTMVKVKGGTFMMGATEDDPEAYDREKPAHQVTLSSYCIGQTEVTQELWVAVMGSNPSQFKGDLQRPVEMVSWNDCQTFIAELNMMTGKQFRLPTEAEWEFAARGGNLSKGFKYSGSNDINDVAWNSDNSDNTPHPVATKMPNELGLYDMSGNVEEKCQDWYGAYGSDSQINPTGPISGSERVERGGAWYYHIAGRCRVSYRGYIAPNLKCNDIGLRLAL